MSLGHTQAYSANDIEEFLNDFSSKCVEFGYYCDQYMREEINLGEITRRLADATGEGESFYEVHHNKMSPEQCRRYDMMQMTLESMTNTLIQTEISRNQKIIRTALTKGEYFIINITFNSITSSIYMIYANPNEKQKLELQTKLAELQKEQEFTQAIMKVLKAFEPRIEPATVSFGEYENFRKVLQLYIQYFEAFEKQPEISPTKKAGNERVYNLFKKHVDYLMSQNYFNNRNKAYAHISECVNILKGLRDLDNLHNRLEALKVAVEPPDPKKIMQKLFNDVIHSTTETDIYSAVVAFNNFAEQNPGETEIYDYKKKIRQHLSMMGML